MLDSIGGITGVFFTPVFFGSFFCTGFFARAFFSTEGAVERVSGEGDEVAFFETVFFRRGFSRSAEGDDTRVRGGINFLKK